MPDRSIEDLMKDRDRTLERFMSAREAEHVARREETAALNAYNQACSAIDRAIADMKKASPPGTDWGSP